MYFNKILVGFIILAIILYIFGDRVAYFRAHMMMNMGYDLTAYEAYDKIVKNYPQSPYVPEAKKMKEALFKRNHEVSDVIKSRDAELKKEEEKRNNKANFH